MSFEFTLCDIVGAGPRQLYDAWLDSKSHSAMTGAAAEISPGVGGSFTAWDGYISGRTLELIPGERIVQSWRTSNFTSADLDSKITLTFARAAGGTRVTLRHSEVPDGHTSYRDGGWQKHYFEPMKRYFSGAD